VALTIGGVFSGACVTSNNARPLAPGEHAVAMTFGGPLIDVPNVGIIPMPNATVEGRHGIIEDLDINYGIHLLPTAYGNPGGHVGATFLVVDEKAFFPALSVGNRLYAFSNLIDGRVDLERRGVFFMHQLDLTASYEIWDQLLYGGVTHYLPFNNPGLFLAPFFGVEFQPGIDWIRPYLELRYLAPYINNHFAAVDYITPFGHGAVNLSFGVAWHFDVASFFGGGEGS
jgi:hypothetical protein